MFFYGNALLLGFFMFFYGNALFSGGFLRAAILKSKKAIS